MTIPADVIYWGTLGVFTVTYLALAWGGVPGLRIDRAGISLAGAAAMLAIGSLSLDDAAKAVDAATIALLLGMMIVVACLQLAGFFAWMTEHVASRFAGPYTLLAVTIGLSGVLSALLVNDVVCVALTPLILKLCQRLKRPPVPYLIALATASNVGSIATITGNPQNIIIGSLSGISYLRFAERLAPVALIGLVVNFVIVALVYRSQLSDSSIKTDQAKEPLHVRIHRPLLIKNVIVTLVTVVLFFCGFPIAIVALAAAGVCLLDAIRPAKIYKHVDWPLLMMFGGLFIIVHAFEVHVVRTWGLESFATKLSSPVVVISGLSVVLSNLVSNVPAVLLFKPLMESIPDKEQAWLALAMSSTCAGNLTLLGSVANLIVVESARKSGIEVSFTEYLKVGVILTIITTAIGIAWLTLVHY